MTRLTHILVLLSLLSCGVESSEIGSDLFNGGGAIDISYIDSATVTLSTMKLDCLVTNSINRILAGSYDDDKLGRTTAAPFIQFTVPSVSGIDLDDDDVVFDHIALTLKHDDYYYNDTTEQLTLNVHRLASDIYTDDYGYIYNTSMVKYDENPLGSLSFLPKPRRNDSLEIELSQALGEELWLKILDNEEDITDQSEFVEYFKGLVVMPDTTTATSVIGFSMSPELRLYYKDKTDVPTDLKYIAFPVTSGRVYSWIHGNRSGSKLAALKNSRQRVKAVETDNEAYMQGGVGVALRVDMPYLRSLTQFENFYVSRAILDLYPVRKSYSATTTLPEQLLVYKVDKRNEQQGSYELPAVLFEDLDLGRETYYQFDVTAFVKEQMALEEFNENALVFMTEDETYRSTIDRLYMAAPGYEYKTRVRIYYATLNY